ncbi:Vms1/Ankzf1 family peptidyl-tRNA hydrolase [Haloarchaeobius sp. FL176]|uniref:Vms1/Ankzf1 family peptidyl-tRNA hydrolase n=1 Tax=Haloarchaeobius sp. FL176 TaxID=2967129 RepID=UPI0021492DB8|nr:Vms1/Ankzf1 family peptidyl-tRNA hydrolase [Haloarchaeobius sp. FL176]
MLDELLGRAALKDRIEELEEETERLAAQLEAESERRADAVSERQDAEERVNRLEDRIAQLEGELDRREDDGDDLAFRDRADLRDERLDAVLGRLESVETEPEGFVSAAVADGADASDAVADLLGDRARLVERATPCLVYADDAGLVSAVLEPPVQPEPFCEWGDSPRIDRSWCQPTGEFALALVRADVFAIGEYDGRERRSARSFESDVKSDHSKGGFSQGRFERIRDEQIRDHLAECRAAISERDADRLFVVGDRRLVGEFSDEAAATAAVDVSEGGTAGLDAALHEFFTTRLSTF